MCCNARQLAPLNGTLWHSTVRYDTPLRATALQGTPRNSTALHSTPQHTMARRHATVLQDTPWNSTAHHGAIRHPTAVRWNARKLLLFSYPAATILEESTNKTKTLWTMFISFKTGRDFHNRKAFPLLQASNQVPIATACTRRREHFCDMMRTKQF